MQAHQRRLSGRPLSQVLHRELVSHDEVVEQDRFLGREVPKDRAATHTGRDGDLIDRRLRVAMADEELQRGLRDATPRFLLVCGRESASHSPQMRVPTRPVGPGADAPSCSPALIGGSVASDDAQYPWGPLSAIRTQGSARMCASLFPRSSSPVPPVPGKTALAKEVSELLWQVDEPHAVIDVNELCRGVLPAGTTDFNRSLAVENLAAVWANFERAGVRRLVLARAIQSADDLDYFAQAISGCTLAACRVTAPRSTYRRPNPTARGGVGCLVPRTHAAHANSMMRSHVSIFPASWWRTVTHDRSPTFRARCARADQLAQAIAHDLIVRGALDRDGETDTGSAPMRGMPVIGS